MSRRAIGARSFAPAKINLTLEVGRPRADGRHPLQSVVAFADVGDWIEAEPADDLTLAVIGPFAEALHGQQDNLVLRAARALAARYDVKSGARLTLEKNLPIASGIGGGSSDAAATLKALRALWALDASDAALSEIGASLGADVPVCVRAQSAYMSGTGEIVAPMAVPPLHAVLINPLQLLSTGAVYKAFDAAGLGDGFEAKSAALWPDVETALSDMRQNANHLTAPAATLLPIIADVLSTLAADVAVLHAALSGSGATCFAIVKSQAEAETLAVRLKALWPDFWIAPTRLGGG